MSLFYAYAKSIKEDGNWRMIITFASREIADEWWRAISEKPTRFNQIQRVTPQLYIHDPDSVNVWDTIKDSEFVSFANKIIFTLIHDRGGRWQNIIPSQEITDHLSGKWYYIRTKCTPYHYWHIQDDIVTTSKDDRTPFRISIQGGRPGTVMIVSDEITISTQAHVESELGPDQTCLEEALVKVNTRAQLCINSERPGSTGLVTMKFGDFQDRLCVLRSDRTVRLLAGSGTPWELTR